MILQSYIIQNLFESGTTVEKEEEGLGIERTHAKFSTYFVTMVPDENYLDAASSILPLPFQVWLRFPDGRLITCYHMGMVRDMLLSSCSPDWGHAERFATDFGLKLNEDTVC
ncbi:hypothetical protein Salat_2965000 [Sesamum alatum]|uniref:Uncharacterized protein n=1 Tax=Sesamum alatum TaxID=300844 RepID=A0AAE1XIN7_9LAMI|nr:hypothetical protein Salat_2971400 [Sesamum alatum]KAK4412237.1 hypothetical protein Salat_2965000 [Sesamum alatum]